MRQEPQTADARWLVFLVQQSLVVCQPALPEFLFAYTLLFKSPRLSTDVEGRGFVVVVGACLRGPVRLLCRHVLCRERVCP